MSLAMYAAPFDDNQTGDTDNAINRKRQTHNKTIKKYPKENFDQQKVNSVLDNIHKTSTDDDDQEETNHLGNFNPPPKPNSIGASKTIGSTGTSTTEEMRTMTTNNMEPDASRAFAGRGPHPLNYAHEGDLELNNLNVNYTDANEYYKKHIPGYKMNNTNNSNTYNKPPPYAHSNLPSFNNHSDTSDILMKKINYMINLLEEQQDEKTNNVTEEVVLYSFLGIFIIFVVDSFAKVGKYVR
jgi:hypothetical protein